MQLFRLDGSVHTDGVKVRADGFGKPINIKSGFLITALSLFTIRAIANVADMPAVLGIDDSDAVGDIVSSGGKAQKRIVFGANQ